MLNPLNGLPRTIYTCPICFLECRTSGGLTQHWNSAHRQFTPQSDNGLSSTYEYHPHLSGKSIFDSFDIVLMVQIAKPCDENGKYLLPHICPQPPPNPAAATGNPWNPFGSRVEFDFAHYHFIEVHNLAPLINKALDLWAATIAEYGKDTPWANAKELYATIDSIQQGDSPWKVYKIRYQGPHPQGTPPKWMSQTYELCT